MLANVVETRPAVTHQSRWGFHPCSREMFLLLKRLHKHYRKSLSAYRVWLRWQRKAPQNRVVRRPILDASGRRIGREIVGPRPEPKLCPVFYGPVKVRVRFHDCKYYPDGIEVDQVMFSDRGIVADYASARFPKADPANVTPLVLTESQVREMLGKLE